MAIDRSKFKPTSVTKMKEDDAATAAATGRKPRGAFPGMLTLEPGKNKLRIYPAHPEEGRDEDNQPGFSQPSVKTFLPMMVDEKDEKGELTGNKKESVKPLFNSRIHGGTEKDLVEEYIKLARAYADATWPDAKDAKQKTAKEKYLNKVYGKYSPNPADREMGINYKTTFVMYADLIKGDSREFGRIEVKQSVKETMNKIAGEEEGDEAMGVDPYTDLDEGRAIVVYYDDKAKKASDYYRVSLDTDIDRTTKMIKLYPIDEERLEAFAKQPTLEKLYVDVFKRKDFELQVAGLEFFDNKNKIGIFETEDFEDVLTEINGYYSENGEEQDEVEEENDTEETDDSSDMFTLMSRVELKNFNKANKLDIIIKTSMVDDVIRDKIRARIKENNKEPLIPADDVDDTPPATTVASTNGTKKVSGLDRLKNLKKKA